MSSRSRRSSSSARSSSATTNVNENVSTSQARSTSTSTRARSSSRDSGRMTGRDKKSLRPSMDHLASVDKLFTVEGSDNSFFMCTLSAGRKILVYTTRLEDKQALSRKMNDSIVATPIRVLGGRESIDIHNASKLEYNKNYTPGRIGYAILSSKGIHVTYTHKDGVVRSDTFSYSRGEAKSSLTVLPCVTLKSISYDIRNRTVIDLLEGSRIHSDFARLIKTSRLYHHLKYHHEKYLILAPTNKAMASIGRSLTVEQAANIVLSHVIFNDFPTGVDIKSSVVDVRTLSYTSVQGTRISIRGDVINDKIKILNVDGYASNGYVHTIDGVIIPHISEKRDIEKIFHDDTRSVSIRDILIFDNKLRAIERESLRFNISVIIRDMEASLNILRTVDDKLSRSCNIQNKYLHDAERYMKFYYGTSQDTERGFKAPYVLSSVPIGQAVDISSETVHDKSADSKIKILDDDGKITTLDNYISVLSNRSSIDAKKYDDVVSHATHISSLRPMMDRILETIKNDNVDMLV